MVGNVRSCLVPFFSAEASKERKREVTRVADTLSRAYQPLTSSDGQSEAGGALLTETKSPTAIEMEHIDMAQFLPIKDQTPQDVKQFIKIDENLRALSSLVTQGWPDKKSSAPQKLQCCFSFREELLVQHDLIFKGQRVVVPSALQQSGINKLYASHIGIQGCLSRAREAFYWPGMNNDITEKISKCSTCTHTGRSADRAHDLPRATSTTRAKDCS